MKYSIQIKIPSEDWMGKAEWVTIRPTNGPVYQFETRQAAQRMLDMCYPDLPVEKKRVKVE